MKTKRQCKIDEFEFVVKARGQIESESTFSPDAIKRAGLRQTRGRLNLDATVSPQDDRLSEAKYRGLKVNQKHLSRLMWDILAYINGVEVVERGEIVESIFELPRRYRHFYTDPSMSLNEKRRYERCYKCAQPSITRSLKRLEQRGLARLIRHRKYVKKIESTAEGRMLVEGLI